jgi:hypothetical protein
MTSIAHGLRRVSAGIRGSTAGVLVSGLANGLYSTARASHYHERIHNRSTVRTAARFILFGVGGVR